MLKILYKNASEQKLKADHFVAKTGRLLKKPRGKRGKTYESKGGYVVKTNVRFVDKTKVV